MPPVVPWGLSTTLRESIQKRRGLILTRNGAPINEHNIGESDQIVGSTTITDPEEIG